MKKKIGIALVLSVILVTLIVSGIHIYSRYTIGFQKVYVASHRLSQRSKLTKEDLEVKEVPKDFVDEEVCIDEREILDHYVKLHHSIPKGSLIYKGALEKESAMIDAAHRLLKKGEATFDLYVSEAKVNTAHLDIGMYVDLYLTIKKERPVSDVLMTGVRIVGLYDHKGEKVELRTKDKIIEIVALAVPKKDISILNEALLLGDISVIVAETTYIEGQTAKLIKDSLVYEYLNH